MAVNTLANFMAAINTTVGAKSGISYYCTQTSDGSILVNNAATGALVWKVVYFALGQAGVAANPANTTGAAVIVGGANDGLNDTKRYMDAQTWITWLAAN